jgi:hypothetical protein
LATIFSLLAITLGTNLYYYASIEAPMSHVYSFSLFAIFVYLSIRWHQCPNLKNSILLGLLAGLIALIRPTNILILFFFVCFGLSRWTDAGRRIRVLWQHIWLVVVMAFSFFLVWIPQLMYWKANAGQWFYYSYGNQHFFFCDPQIINGLFSYRKGWLLYTPMIGLSIVGLRFLNRYARELLFPVILFIIINFYVVVCWWTWWYGGGFGLRPMIDSYALMVFPLAAFFEWLLHQPLRHKILGFTLGMLLLVLSLFQSMQYVTGAIHWDSMTKEAYWNSFGRLFPSAEFQKMLKVPDYENAIKGQRDH